MQNRSADKRASSNLQGWTHRDDRWALLWNGRECATIQKIPGGARVVVDMGKMWEVEEYVARSPEEGKSRVERQATAALMPGVPLEQVITWLACERPLPDLPERAGLPPGFRWIKSTPTAKRSTIVAYGEQCVAALLQRNRSEPVRALLALHRTCASEAQQLRDCSSWDLGRRGIEMWISRHQGRIAREMQQANRLRGADSVAGQLALQAKRDLSD